MSKFSFVRASFLCAALAVSALANAAPVATFGAGSAVTAATNSANFNTMVDGSSLSPHVEGGMSFSKVDGSSTAVCEGGGLCGNHIGFTGMSGGIFYNSGTGTSITGTSNQTFYALEAMLGTGFFESSLHAVWETYLNNVLTGHGSFDTTAGTILGLADANGFNKVVIGTYMFGFSNTFIDVNGNGATALDNVSAQSSPSSNVPEPTSLALLGLALSGLALSRRKKA